MVWSVKEDKRRTSGRQKLLLHQSILQTIPAQSCSLVIPTIILPALTLLSRHLFLLLSLFSSHQRFPFLIFIFTSFHLFSLPISLSFFPLPFCILPLSPSLSFLAYFPSTPLPSSAPPPLLPPPQLSSFLLLVHLLPTAPRPLVPEGLGGVNVVEELVNRLL